MRREGLLPYVVTTAREDRMSVRLEWEASMQQARQMWERQSQDGLTVATVRRASRQEVASLDLDAPDVFGGGNLAACPDCILPGVQS